MGQRTPAFRYIVMVALLIGGTLASRPIITAEAAVAGRDAKIKSFMRQKLKAADQILEGITTPNMPLIRKGATAMIHMSKEAMWVSFKSPSYTQDSADFVRTAERLIELTTKNDLEGASHTYAQLTIQCANCHRRLRDQGERVVMGNGVREAQGILFANSSSLH